MKEIKEDYEKKIVESKYDIESKDIARIDTSIAEINALFNHYKEE